MLIIQSYNSYGWTLITDDVLKSFSREDEDEEEEEERRRGEGSNCTTFELYWGISTHPSKLNLLLFILLQCLSSSSSSSRFLLQ